jgi:hypothetical protein
MSPAQAESFKKALVAPSLSSLAVAESTRGGGVYLCDLMSMMIESGERPDRRSS